MHKYVSLFVIALTLPIKAFSGENAPPLPAASLPLTPPPPPKEEIAVTTHSVIVNGISIPYTTTVGTQTHTDEHGVAKGTIFYIAYTKNGVTDPEERPITFCFNGGPGSSSVWLHLGVFGPKRVSMNKLGTEPTYPFQLIDNYYSILDTTDLVFIDPISTGYSRAVDGESDKQFHGVKPDINSVSEFIRLYVTRNQKWNSPKFIAGESYGTTRAVGVALELHDHYYLYLDGIILVSSILDFQTISFNSGNDLAYIVNLPSYTATALYHKKLSKELQADPKATLKLAEEFTYGEYAKALLYGDILNVKHQRDIEEKLSRFTGISKDYIKKANLRVNSQQFAKALLSDEMLTLGRFDSRYAGVDLYPCRDTPSFDPSLEAILGVFTSTFNDYVVKDLNWKKDEEYKILTDVGPWDYTVATNQYLNMSDKLRDVMSKNPRLGVFVASGIDDLATPYFATHYTFTHLNLAPSLRDHVVLKDYEGGHMMYLYQPSLESLTSDIRTFINHQINQ